MGGHKPALTVGGRPIIVRILQAAHAHRTVVVGRPDAVPDGVEVVREEPPGGGPVAGVAAGLTAIDLACARDDTPAPELVAVLAGDLPFLTAAALTELFAAMVSGPVDSPGPDVALVADREGSLNWLCAVWRTEALRARLAALEAPVHVEPPAADGLAGRGQHAAPDEQRAPGPGPRRGRLVHRRRHA